MVPRPAHLKDPPSDDELLTEDDRRNLALIRLKRYCFVGTFEPVRKHLPLPTASDVYTTLNKFCKLLDSNRFLRILRTAFKSKLVRRDEATLLYAVYLMGDADIKHKTKVREDFVNLIKTDVDLFLFCKYATSVHKMLKRPIFCKTIKKAITAWYSEKSSKELCEIFRTNRGRNGFTHVALMKMCRISDHVLGSKYIFDSFEKSCTTLIAERERTLPPPPQPKMVKQKTATKEIVKPKTQPNVTTDGETAGDTQQETKEQIPLVAIPPKECNVEEVRSQVLAISELRTVTDENRAIQLIEEFQLGFEHLPYHLMKHPEVLKKVIPSMNCQQLLECFHAKEVKKHFLNSEVMEICRKKFYAKNALKNEEIDPIMCLINLDNINVHDPIKVTNNKKKNRGHFIQFSKVLFQNSFKETIPMKLNVNITINMQDFYMKKELKNTKGTLYKYAATALAYTFFNVEEICDIYRWCENEYQLQPVEFKKKFNYRDAFKESTQINNLKNKQHLWLPIAEALKQKDTKKYDLFILIVPAATRGNKKHCSELLAEHLVKYRRACENNAKLVIVDLCRFKKSMRYAKTSCENILEICGLDVHTVGLIQNFALGRFD